MVKIMKEPSRKIILVFSDQDIHDDIIGFKQHHQCHPRLHGGKKGLMDQLKGLVPTLELEMEHI